MLGAMNLLAIVRADVERFCGLYDRSAGCCPVEMCELATGAPPTFVEMTREGAVIGGQIYLSSTLTPRRARCILAFQLAYLYYARLGYNGPDLTERAERFITALLMPGPSFIQGLMRTGFSHRALADVYDVTETASLVRIAETVGRPTVILRPGGVVFRGNAFHWPASVSSFVTSLRAGTADVETVPILDEPNRVGLVAKLEAWAAPSLAARGYDLELRAPVAS